MKNMHNMERLLAELKNQREKANIELAYCPKGRLVQVMRRGKNTFFQVDSIQGERKRKSINRYPDRILWLARKKYLETEIALLDDDINIVEKLIKLRDASYIEPTVDNILNRLPNSFKKLPENWFFLLSGANEYSGFSIPGGTMTGAMMVVGTDNKAGTGAGIMVGSLSLAGLDADVKGMTELERRDNYLNMAYGDSNVVKIVPWDMQPYEKSQFRPENLVHTTSRGLKVRSKSEVMIAEKLYEYNIPFRYEEVLHIGARVFVPDFTLNLVDDNIRDEKIRVDSLNMQDMDDRGNDGIFYWEHCGMTSNKQYMLHHNEKIQAYEEIGIVPWKNLIVTYDDESGNINMSIIESEIRNKLIWSRQ